VDGVPDRRRFLEVVGSAVRTLTSDGRRLRVFGEMVALLWADGHAEAALRLEGYWNELLRSTAFSLFCAYPLSAFPLSSDGPGFSQVCDRHGVIIPAESYADRRDADDRTRHIAVLQQKALSLESEMAQRSELQERLSARERELRDFLEHAVVPLHQVGPDGRILWANKAELDLLGYQPDEYIGRHIADFHVDRDVIDDMLARLLRGEALYDHPARMRAKDGSIKHVLIHSNGCFDGDRFLYTRCFTRDITERRRIEDERDRLLKQLEDERRRLNHLHVELQEKIRDLEEFHDCVVGRELKMIELQEEVETYRAKLRELGQPV
jgi:PAS domain S-box-containing protein